MASKDEDLQGRTVTGPGGERLGVVNAVFADQGSGRWEWAVVRPGATHDDHQDRMVPLRDAVLEGDLVAVPYDLATVAAAPDLGGGGHLSVEDEAQLYEHYGLDPRGEGVVPDTRYGGTSTGIPPLP